MFSSPTFALSMRSLPKPPPAGTVPVQAPSQGHQRIRSASSVGFHARLSGAKTLSGWREGQFPPRRKGRGGTHPTDLSGASTRGKSARQLEQARTSTPGRRANSAHVPISFSGKERGGITESPLPPVLGLLTGGRLLQQRHCWTSCKKILLAESICWLSLTTRNLCAPKTTLNGVF